MVWEKHDSQSRNTQQAGCSDGFLTVSDPQNRFLRRQLANDSKKKIDKGAGERWREGLEMFSTVRELQADAEEAFNCID